MPQSGSGGWFASAGASSAGDFDYDEVVKLTRGKDSFGCRGEILTLVNLAILLDGGHLARHWGQEQQRRNDLVAPFSINYMMGRATLHPSYI